MILLEEKMIIIDGNSLINRAYYAMPLLNTKSGVFTNAVYGFVNMLYRVLEDYQPDYIAVAFDRKAPTFRHLEFEPYKAGRKKMPPELAQQIPILKNVLDAFQIYQIEIDGFEADDLIGTLARYCENKNVRSFIVTGDKDALQLVSSKVQVLITKKGISSLEIYDEQAVIETYGITPEQFIDLKGLMGDKSDNIPGVPGIGEKTGTKLIREFNSIENLLQNLDQVSSSATRKKLEEYAQQAILSKRLATIVTDVPVELSIEKMRYREPNYDKLFSLFRELEFYSLLDRIDKNKQKEDVAAEKTEKKMIIVDSDDGLDTVKEKIKKAGFFYFKIFYDGEMVGSYTIAGVSLLIDEETHCFFDVRDDSHKIQYLKDIFEDPDIKKYGHQIKQDILALKCLEISVKNISFDTAIAAYLIDPTRNTYEISSIAAEYLGKTIEKEEEIIGKGKKKVGYLAIDIDKIAQYGFDYCCITRELMSFLSKKIEEYDLQKLYNEVEIPLIEVLADMEFRGFRVDQDKLEEIGKSLEQKILQLTDEIYQEAGETFNINSTKQLGEILFERLKLPPIKKTKTGYSTNIDVLEKLYHRHPIIPKIIEYRQFMKIKSTYIDGLKTAIHEKTGKIHSSFNQTITSTGRISSTEPNLQNIPIKMDIGRQIRKVFVPTSADYLLLDADYSQIELRVLAHISQDPDLIEAFHNELDIHAATASKVFNVPIDQVTPLQRSRAKAVNFGIIYGISDYGLSENLHITRKEAQRYIDEYFDKYRGVKAYMDRVVQEGRDKGYVTTLLNRRREIPEILSKNFNLRSFGERTAMNTPIQGTAADIIKIAMVQVYQRLKEQNLKSSLILQVHDELILEVHKDEVEQVKEMVQWEMEHAMALDVPLKVEISIGENWYDTK